MQAYFKDNNTLIINTMIDKNEKDRLVDFVSAADNVTFKKLYDIEGEVSGIMFIKSDIPSIEVMKGISTVISFDLSDDNDVLIDVNDIETPCIRYQSGAFSESRPSEMRRISHSNR